MDRDERHEPHRSEIGDARVAGISRSPLLRLPIRLTFLGQEKNQELLLPVASDCAWVRAIAKDQRGRLDEERLAGFNQSADPSTYRRKNSVRTTRATAMGGERCAQWCKSALERLHAVDARSCRRIERQHLIQRSLVGDQIKTDQIGARLRQARRRHRQQPRKTPSP